MNQPKFKNQDEFNDYFHSLKKNGVSHKELTATAFGLLESTLQGYGNTLSEDHRVALYELLSRYTMMIRGELEGRVAYGLDTGMGKTESLVALVTAIDQLKLDHVSVLICQSKVEGLCSLKRKMIDMGVSETKIGLIHSYEYDPAKLDVNGKVIEDNYASLPATPIDEHRQFQLVTHNRVRGGSDLTGYNTFNDAPRSLAVWDESLLISDAESTSAKDIEKAITSFNIDYRDSSKHNGLLSYFLQFLDYIKVELKAQVEGEAPNKLPLPAIDKETKSVYRQLINQIKGSQYKKTLSALIGMGDDDLRMLRTSQGDGVVSYTITIPKALNKVIILDASWWIRELQKLDPSITDTATKFINTSLKKYDNVTVHQMLQAGGRASMTNDFNGSREKRKTSKEIATVIKDIPESEAVLVFTYKTRVDEPDFIKLLKSDLSHYGINLEQTVKAKVQGKDIDVPRFNFLTWGSETSLNEFSYCTNVILAGILHRSHLDLGSSILGQQDDLTKNLNYQDIKRIHDTELAHLTFQAMSRGSCRAINNGYAQPMKAWIIHSDIGIKTILESVMTGVKWELWDEVDSENKGIIARTAFDILVYLDSQLEGRLSISTSAMKKELKLTKVPSTSWTNALTLALSQTKRWKLDGRSVVKMTEFDSYFPD